MKLESRGMRRPYRAVFTLLLIAGCGGTPADAPDPQAEQEVRDIVQATEDALNARDFDAFFSTYTEDADLVVFDGPRANGRTSAQALMEQGWANTPADVRASLTVESVRFVTAAVAIANIEASFEGSEPSRDRATAVLVNRGDGWQVNALRVIQPEGGRAIAAADDYPDAVTADPDHYSVEFENSLLRLIRIRYGPGEASSMHYHPANCGIFLTQPTFEMTIPAGAPPSEAEPAEAGDVSCTDAETHNPRNTGARTAELILVEMKGRETVRP